MALHRKKDALLSLKPDIAVVCECAKPEILAERGAADWIESEPVWIGNNPNKGLGVFAFNGFTARLHEPFFPTLQNIAPVHISGPVAFNLLAAWAQNLSGGVTRKHQLGPLRRSFTKYSDFFAADRVVVAGDLNNNAIWDRPGWRVNHMTKVAILEKMGLRSVYHERTGDPQGEERTPTHYWRDRKKDGPTYHIDYIFLPEAWLGAVTDFRVGTFEDWCGNGLSDHVPLVVDIDRDAVAEIEQRLEQS